MRLLVIGARGFLGAHVRNRAQASRHYLEATGGDDVA